MPERMCVMCRGRFEKDELYRLVKPDGEVSLDGSGKANCRGTYICRGCMPDLVKKRGLDRAFKTKIAADVYEKILSEVGSND